MKFIGCVGLGLGLALLAWAAGPWRATNNVEPASVRPAHSAPHLRASPVSVTRQPAVPTTAEGRSEAVSTPVEGRRRQELELAELDDDALATLIDDLGRETESAREEFKSLEERRSAALRAGKDDEADRLYARSMLVTERRQLAVAALTRASFEQTCRALDDCDGNPRSAFFDAAE